MSGAQASAKQLLTLVWLVTMSAILVVALGCSDDDTKPTYPDRDDPPAGTWFLSVWGTGADDVYAVGSPGLIVHWDGTDWTCQESGTSVILTEIWGDGSDIYICGHDGVILKKSGNSWSPMTTDTDADLFGIGNMRDVSGEDTTVIHFACGRDGTVLRLNGESWSPAPNMAYIRRDDAEQSMADSFRIDDSESELYVESYTSVAFYGITGADGAILMDEREFDNINFWRFRRITGGTDWVTCSTSSRRVSGNFVASDGGRIAQLQFDSDTRRYSWGGTDYRYEPLPLETAFSFYGLYADNVDTVWAVTNDGRIFRVDPDGEHHVVYEDGLTLFNIWGEDEDEDLNQGGDGINLYAVGINGRILHFHLVNDEYRWVDETPLLPLDVLVTKSLVGDAFDKYGRPVR